MSEEKDKLGRKIPALNDDVAKNPLGITLPGFVADVTVGRNAYNHGVNAEHALIRGDGKAFFKHVGHQTEAIYEHLKDKIGQGISFVTSKEIKGEDPVNNGLPAKISEKKGKGL